MLTECMNFLPLLYIFNKLLLLYNRQFALCLYCKKILNVIWSSLRISNRPKNMTSHLVGVCILTAQHHNSQILLLCLKNTLHFQFSGTKSVSGLTFYKKIACAHCPCSPVKDIRQHHIYTYVHIVSLHVHYYISMQALLLLGLHATVRGAGLPRIRACHAGVYATGRHHL